MGETREYVLPKWFGTTSIPVPDTSIGSVSPPKIPSVPVSPTEHTLENQVKHLHFSVELSFICHDAVRVRICCIACKPSNKAFSGEKLKNKGRCPPPPIRTCTIFHPATRSSAGEIAWHDWHDKEITAWNSCEGGTLCVVFTSNRYFYRTQRDQYTQSPC